MVCAPASRPQPDWTLPLAPCARLRVCRAEAKLLPKYVKEGILPADPFETLDTSGVGELIKLAVQRGRAARPELHIGICGELLTAGG